MFRYSNEDGDLFCYWGAETRRQNIVQHSPLYIQMANKRGDIQELDLRERLIDGHGSTNASVALQSPSSEVPSYTWSDGLAAIGLYLKQPESPLLVQEDARYCQGFRSCQGMRQVSWEDDCVAGNRGICVAIGAHGPIVVRWFARSWDSELDCMKVGSGQSLDSTQANTKNNNWQS